MEGVGEKTVVAGRLMELSELVNQDWKRRELRPWREIGMAPAHNGLEDACRAAVYRLAAIRTRMTITIMLMRSWLIAIEKMVDSMRRRVNQEKKKQPADCEIGRAAHPRKGLAGSHCRVITYQYRVRSKPLNRPTKICTEPDLHAISLTHSVQYLSGLVQPLAGSALAGFNGSAPRQHCAPE